MKIEPFLAEIEAKTLDRTHYGVWVLGEWHLLEGDVYLVFYGIMVISVIPYQLQYAVVVQRFD